jgi:hypothetical protein
MMGDKLSSHALRKSPKKRAAERGGVAALLQAASSAPFSPGTVTARPGLSLMVRRLLCSVWVTVGAPELGTWRPFDGSAGYNSACSIQFSQTTNGY